MKIMSSKKEYCFSKTEINILSELIADIKKEDPCCSDYHAIIGRVIEDITLEESKRFFDYDNFDVFTIKVGK